MPKVLCDNELELEHPIQPIYKDEHGVPRFKSNKIVEYLLEVAPADMNRLACMNFDQKDREQFAQLIGYSVSGFGDLSYARQETVAASDAMAAGSEASSQALRMVALELRLKRAQEAMAEGVAALYGIHPDDLKS